MSRNEPLRILTVCLGNICRSPTAEAAIREAARDAGLDVEVDSAGTGAWHVGEPPDRRMRQAAAGIGLEITGRARQVSAIDFDRFDLILAMDSANHAELLRLAPTPDAADKVHLFLSFDRDAAEIEVPDPYYGGPDGFENVVQLVRSAARALVDDLVASRR